MSRVSRLRSLSNNKEGPIILSTSGSLRWEAWNAAEIGSLDFEALDNRSENEKRSSSVDGGPLIVADESDSALIYALLFRGIISHVSV